MPRKGPAAKRPVVADPVYSSPVVSQLVNKILLDGKKGLAERIVYGALAGVGTKSGQDAVVVVLPASMCAMIPMLRTLRRSVRTSCATSSQLSRRGDCRV